MKIAFNPSTVAALTSPPNNKDITFDLRGQNIFARGVKFYGTDTWRPVVDNLTSNSATSSLSANQGRVLAGLINGKSDSDHNHDGRYLKLTGGTLTGNLVGTSAMFSGRFYGNGDDEGIIIKPFSNGYAGLILGTHDGERSIFYFVKNKPFWRYSHGSDNLDIIHPKKSGTIALTSDIPTSLKNPHALTISLNGTSQGPYDGSAAKNINITPGSIGAAVSNHSHDYLVVNTADDKSFNSAYHNFQVLYAGGSNGITGKPANVDAFGLFRFRAASGWSGQMLLANGGSLYIRSSEDAKMTNTLAWKTILDSSNYSGILDSRYYTESEVNSLLSKKLDRVNLSVGSWNPRGYNLAADYFYNGGDLSISESKGQIHVSIDGYFWQNEGQYRVLDTSDVAGLKGDLTVHQYLSNIDTTWWPLIWGGSSHANTSDSTGAVYKSHDVLSWQTSSQTLYATNIRTENIKHLSIGGGIYWNPNVESATDGSDAASITLVKSGIAGGTTLVLSQMNDANDTIQFKTNTAAKLYHNSYPILTTQNTYVSNHKGYINGTEITQVNNADTVDGWHKDEINRTLFITSGISGLSSYWAKLWEINLNNQYDDVTITFLAAASYYPSYFSIFSVYLRQNGTGTSKSISARLVELIGNIAVGDTELRLYVNNTTGNCQLWGNVKSQYGTMNLSVLKKAWRTANDSSNIGTFFSTNFSSVQSLPGDGWNKIGVTQQVLTGTFNPSSHTHSWDSITGKPSSFTPSAHNHDGRYLRLSGDDTMNGPLRLKNNTWNFVGDDVKIGDHNVSGGLGILGANGSTRIDFCQYGKESNFKSITFDGTTLYLDGTSYNSDHLSGLSVNNTNVQKPFGKIPVIASDGVTELGRYIDFHYDNSGSYDFSTRLQASGNNKNIVTLPSASGTLALTSDILNYYWANVKISTSSSTTTSPTVHTLTATRICAGHDPGIDNSISCSNWFRSSGNTGWYNTTYKGGIYMSDTSWIRTHHNVGIYAGQIYADSSIRMSSIRLERTNEINSSDDLFINYGSSTNVSLCNGGGNVCIGAFLVSSYKLDVRGTVRSTGFYHASHSNNDAVLLAGGGYKILKDFIFLNVSYNYTDNAHYNLTFHKLSGICNNLVWVDGHVKGSISKSFAIDMAVFPYRYDGDPDLKTICIMGTNDYISVDAVGVVRIVCNDSHRVGFFYTGIA